MMAINLEKTPKTYDLHTWGDYVELLCLTNQDGLISKEDIVARLRDRNDLDIDGEEGNIQDIPDIEDDKQEQIAEDWFRHLEYRYKVFKDFYPFTISPDRDTLLLKNSLTQRHKFYIYLLASSNLRCIFPRSIRNNLTSNFERVSCQALKQCLPEAAQVHIFGTSGKRYTGNKWQKIQQLANDLHETVIISKDKFNKHDSGDAGLDIVGWLPLGDNSPGKICFFGQCACTDNWDVKQHSSSPVAWRSRLTLTAPPCNVIFIPHCFRDSSGNWWKPQDIHESILFDRSRLIYLLREHYASFEEIGLYKDVTLLISKSESLV